MLRLTACLMLAILTIGYAVAEGEKAGKFDYYVMALSWSPSWCALEGDRRNSSQCEPQSDYGFKNISEGFLFHKLNPVLSHDNKSWLSIKLIFSSLLFLIGKFH